MDIVLTPNNPRTLQKVKLSTLGASLIGVIVKTKDDHEIDIVNGADDSEALKRQIEDLVPVREWPYNGATVGRIANRIKDAKFSLDGKEYQLEQNLGGNILHGGANNWALQTWDIVHRTSTSVTMRLLSKDGDSGFPGDLEVQTTYALLAHKLNGVDMDELVISYHAKIPSKDSKTHVTLCNITNHAYWNLTGMKEPTILNHTLAFPTSGVVVGYLPQDGTGCPLPDGKIERFTPGKLSRPMEFPPEGCTIGSQIKQVADNKGYDHCYVLDPTKSWDGHNFKGVVRLSSDMSGVAMTVRTQDPGMQIYCGNWLGGLVPYTTMNKQTSGSSDKGYGEYAGVAFECSRLTSAITHPEWANSVIVRPHQEYVGKTAYGFCHL